MSSSEREGGNPWLSYRPLVLAIALVVVIAAIYAYNFSGGFSSEQGVWGQFGDFMGGVVNPLLNLVTIWLLVGTFNQQQQAVQAAQKSLREQQRAVEAAHESVLIQKDALNVQRQELADTRAELANSAAALAHQVEQFDRKSEKDDLFSRADTVFQEITDVMREPTYGSNIRFRRWLPKEERWHSGYEIEQVIGKTVGAIIQGILQQPYDLEVMGSSDGGASEKALRRLARLLVELEFYLSRIEKIRHGDGSATGYYKRRVSEIARSLAQCHLLDEAIEKNIIPKGADRLRPPVDLEEDF